MTAPARTRPAPIRTLVVGTRALSPTLTRVVLGGPELSRFQASSATDSYVKLTFPAPGVVYPRPMDLPAIRAQMPPEHWPVVRTYTVRSWDATAGELTIDFVVHGDSGVAGPWAASAQTGDELLLSGPGGAYAPPIGADFRLYVGDESALPAIAAALDSLPPQAIGRALIEVHDASSEIPLDAPTGVIIDWVHAGERPVGAALVDAVGALQFPADAVDAFVHGEAGFVKELRRVLRVERGVPKERLSISGYWRLGASEEGWRDGKAEWNRQAEEVERAAGLE